MPCCVFNVCVDLPCLKCHRVKAQSGEGQVTAALQLTDLYACTQDFVVEQLQQIPGVTLVEPKGAFYCLPVMASFFGPSASADGFGAIPDADALCRWASLLYHAV